MKNRRGFLKFLGLGASATVAGEKLLNAAPGLEPSESAFSPRRCQWTIEERLRELNRKKIEFGDLDWGLPGAKVSSK